MAQSHLGNIKNKPVCFFGAKSIPQATNTDLTKGQVVFQDAALGVKVVPTSSQPSASKIGVIENDSKNNPGALGAKSVEVYKHLCIAVVKLDGTLAIDGKVRASTTTAGRVIELADVADAVLNASFSNTEVQAEIDLIRDFSKFYLADYLGHTDEYLNANKQNTAGADGDEIVIGFK